MKTFIYDDLAPCPKCGCSFKEPGFCEFAAPVIYRVRKHWLVACDNCEAQIPEGFETPEQARKAWNAFANSTPPQLEKPGTKD